MDVQGETEFPPPFGPAEWSRLRALDAHCNLTFDRHHRDQRGTGVSHERDFVWMVTIHLRHARAYDTIRAVARSLKDATLAALAEAEAREWHIPASRRSSADL